MQQVDEVTTLDAQGSCPFVAEALTALRQEVGNATTVLGFVGAPFTLACYVVEVSPADKPGTESANPKSLDSASCCWLAVSQQSRTAAEFVGQWHQSIRFPNHPVYCVAQHHCC